MPMIRESCHCNNLEAIRKLGSFFVDLLSRNAVVEHGLAMTGQPSEHQVDVADLDHCGARFGPPFIVFAVTPTTPIPGIGTLHNPAFFQWRESLGSWAHDMVCANNLGLFPRGG